MIPVIIVTKNPDKAVKALFDVDINQPHVDRLVLESQTSIGIDAIKEVEHFTYHKPDQLKHKFIIIKDSQKLTQIAQQALLKSLEEAPSFIQYILCTPTQDSLLPTIQSRCLITHFNQKQNYALDSTHEPLVKQLPTASISEKIDLAATFGNNKQSALDTIFQLIIHYRKQNQQKPSSNTASILKNLTTAHKHISANANPQLTIEHLFFTTSWK